MARRSNLQVIIAALIALGGVVTYFSTRNTNPVTGEIQHVSLTPDQEISIGRTAEPEMIAQYGGEKVDREAEYVREVGERVVKQGDAAKTPYQYEFHLLADPRMVNAFALPGGQVFITEGLLRLLHNEAELAGVLGHEVGHVVARHGAEQLAKQGLTQSLVGAATVYSYDPNRPGRSYATAAMAAAVGQLVNMRYGRDDELEADGLGVRYVKSAGYDPKGMSELMVVLDRASHGNRVPDFFSTHPNPQNRLGRIEQEIQDVGGAGGDRGEQRFHQAVQDAPRSSAPVEGPGVGVGGSGPGNEEPGDENAR